MAPRTRVVIGPIEIRRLRQRKSREVLKCVNEVRALSFPHSLWVSYLPWSLWGVEMVWVGQVGRNVGRDVWLSVPSRLQHP